MSTAYMADGSAWRSGQREPERGPTYGLETLRKQVARLTRERDALRAACEAFVACRKCVGWDEGECDLFLGVALDKARAALSLVKPAQAQGEGRKA